MVGVDRNWIRLRAGILMIVRIGHFPFCFSTSRFSFKLCLLISLGSFDFAKGLPSVTSSQTFLCALNDWREKVGGARRSAITAEWAEVAGRL